MKTKNTSLLNCLFVCCLITPVSFFGQDGTLDLTFGTAGKVITNIISTNYDQAYGMTIQSDGKIVMVGSSGSDFAVVRYNTDGSADLSFDADGKVTTSIAPGGSNALAVAIQADGKIVVVGGCVGVANDFAVVRYNADGSLDTSFDGDGIVITDIGTKDDYAFAVAIQADNKIVVAGHSSSGPKYHVAVARYNTNGSLDVTFDGDGKVVSMLTTDDSVHSIGIQNDGKIVVGGESHDGVTLDFLLTRFNTNGSLDLSFDTDGRVTTAFGITGHERGRSLAIQSNGKILLGGSTDVSGNADFALARYNSDGSLDGSFDGDGKVTTAFTTTLHEGATAIALLPNGKIVMTGVSQNLGTTDIALARYNADGSLDNSFDSDGKVITPGGLCYDPAYTMTLQADGKILVGGGSSDDNKNNFALRRYNNSVVSGLNQLSTQTSKINVYPNPSNGRLNLTTDMTRYTLEIFDLTGVIVYSKDVSGTTAVVDLPELSQGVYIYKTLDASGQQSVGRLVIDY